MSGKKRVVYFCHLLANVRNLESFLPILDCFVFPLLHTRGWGGHTYIGKPVLESSKRFQEMLEQRDNTKKQCS